MTRRIQTRMKKIKPGTKRWVLKLASNTELRRAALSLHLEKGSVLPPSEYLVTWFQIRFHGGSNPRFDIAFAPSDELHRRAFRDFFLNYGWFSPQSVYPIFFFAAAISMHVGRCRVTLIYFDRLRIKSIQLWGSRIGLLCFSRGNWNK